VREGLDVSTSTTARVIDRAAFFESVDYKPHREQLLYHNSTARFRVPVCGRRFGKSMMAGHDLEPKLFTRKKMYWIIGPTYDLGEKEFRVVWDDLIIKMGMGKDKRIKRAYNKKQGNMWIELPWGTRLEVRSADHPENLVGEALDGAILSEAAKHKIETWQRFIFPSLSDKRGWADFPTTPEGFNWLHQMWQLGQNPDHPLYESWQFPSWANTVIFPGGRQDEEILHIERTTVPEWFAQEYGADFASFVGKIFPEWEEKLHVKKVPFDPDLPNYMFFDWGYTNPLAAVEVQITPSDEIRIWREHYKSFMILDDHIRQLKNREHPDGYHLDLAFGDPAEPDSIAQVSRDLVPCVAIKEIKSEYSWMDGIKLMRSFMKPIPQSTNPYDPNSSIVVVDEYGTPAPDRPRYFVDHSCTNTIREHNNYRSKEPIKGQNVPEIGQRVDDHTLDAIRYGLVYIYKYGALSKLRDVYQGSSWRPPLATTTTAGSLADITLDSSPGGSIGAGFGNIDGMDF
jgi:hypothetical protein